MKKNIIVLILISFSVFSHSQTIEKIAEAELKSVNNFDLKSSIINSVNDKRYDVNRYDLTFDLTNTSSSFSGVSKIFATILEDTQSIVLDAQDNLTITSVQVTGENISYTHDNDELKIELNRALSINSSVEIEVKYHSNYSTANGIFSQTQNGTPIITTLSEPYGASSWWVGADNLKDKADLVNIYAKHSPNYKVGANGKLISREVNNGITTTHWQTSYPIPAYLISVAMTDYEEYNNQVTIGGTNVPIINYIYPNSNTSYVQNQLDMVPSYMTFFSDLIGDYPFKEEKYGHAQWNWNGGMEHSTMSFQNSFGTYLTAHELAHQWFGDKVTCATWSDIWLNEGFATYFEGILRRNMYGEDFFTDWKNAKISNITSANNGSVYIPENQLTESRIFSSRLSYNKGAMVLNMLRFKLGDDNFYKAIRNYVNDSNLSYGFAKTQDLINHLESVSQIDLTEFFADWLYGEGYPIFDIKLNLNHDKKSGVLTVNQTTSHNSVDFFETPFEIEFFGNNGESMIKKFDLNQNNQDFDIQDIMFEITDYKFNPRYDIIAKVKSQTLGLNDILNNKTSFKIYPNPAINQIFVLSPSQINFIKIYNTEGRLVKPETIKSNEGEINISTLSKGIYIVEALTKDGVFIEKIIKE